MKRLMIIQLMLAALFFTAHAGTGDTKNISSAFRKGLTDAVKAYYDIGQALAADDSKTASEKAARFKERLDAINSASLTGETQTGWKKQSEILQEAADNLIAAQELAGQRPAFLKISETLIEAVKQYGPLDATAYRYHCPMALSSGGDWLSPVEKVANPYFGRQMPTCGTLVESFEVKSK
ncbi:MAG: DUF3347 domain-containing protein [Calditrichaeota bacterium]|nr:DUF3347 domain-containing protein [Calditrichota bacterium]